jgi:tripartite-type tricarboxylate transporter receptor subunit TctC
MAAAAAVLAALTTAAHAAPTAPWPARPVKVIVPYPAGGGLDVLVRPVAAQLSSLLGQQFVIENKVGANGIIGTEAAAKSAADGYVILAATTGALPLNAALRSDLPFDPVKDFTPISILTDAPFVLAAAPSSSIKTLDDVIELSRKDPGSVTYATSGLGSTSHLAAELFSKEAGITMTHVPYSGNAPATQDVLAGRVMVMFDSVQATLPLFRSHRLVPIAIASKERSPAAPDIPTFAELGLPGVQAGSWYGLVAPAGTPAEVIDRLHAATVKAMETPQMHKLLDGTGPRIVAGTPAEFADTIKSDLAIWSGIIKAIGLTQN